MFVSDIYYKIIFNSPMHHIIVVNGHHRVHCDCKHSVPVKIIILCTTPDENIKDFNFSDLAPNGQIHGINYSQIWIVESSVKVN